MKNQLSIFLFFTLFTASSCDNEDCISGQGDSISKEYNINNINQIDIYSKAIVFLSKGETNLRIEGQSNVLEALNINDSDNTLTIGKGNCFKDIATIKIYLSTPLLNSIDLEGNIQLYSQDEFASDHFSISGSGIIKMDLTVTTNNLITDFSGELDVFIRGSVNEHELDINGKGTIRGFQLLTSNTSIDLSGQAIIETNVVNHLNVLIEGNGEVHYKGNPHIEQDITGNGRIINKN
ncbi:MAG: DUF2807 domain-containing protein [Carboxylicivirga sp.]|jgi:hypothetical protein|nr:DUF2807 domain-containing protein [Carboxylicivirga sp.]